MTDETVMPELLEFFKALAEPKRLQIVGLLAQKSYTGEQLAALLGLSEGTVSHHLSYLVHAGLVSAEAQGYYSVYTLRLDRIHQMAKRLMSQEALPQLAADHHPHQNHCLGRSFTHTSQSILSRRWHVERTRRTSAWSSGTIFSSGLQLPFAFSTRRQSPTAVDVLDQRVPTG